MSEALPGLEMPFTPAAVRDSAAVVLVRGPIDAREVFWVQRGKALANFAGFRAFPGGRVDATDVALPIEGTPDDERALRSCALRELFEETGVLLARGPELPASRKGELRRAVLDGKQAFDDLLATEHLALDGAALVSAGRWVTPPFLPVRFDNRLFLAELPAGAAAEVWPGELASGEWIRPSEALARWAKGETLLHPPNLHAVRCVAEPGSLAELAERLRHPPDVADFISDRIEFQQGILLVPLRTPTLPPATHTNAYVLGNGERVIVDPGSPDPVEQQRLAAFLRRLQGEGARLRALVLTHHHGDHVGGVAALQKELGLELWCHPLTASRVGRADRLLDEGDRIDLAGSPPMSWDVLFTPGHARGHLCLFHRPSRAVVCGDMVAGQSTIIIDPPEGNLGHYLAQLERLKALPAGTLYQSHGAPIAEGQAKLDEYLAHRRARVAALDAALQKGPQTVSELVAEVYADTPPLLHPIAERSALASLEWLIEQGRAARDGERFTARR